MSQHEYDDFTLFDIFNKNGFIYLIMSINNIPISNEDINISVDNKKLEFIEKYEKNSREPIIIFLYKFESNIDVNVNIKYKNIERIFVAKYISSKKKGFLALSTLFKNDYVYFNTYYKYYMKQGVDHFYMFYNGKITKEIYETLNYPNVTLIEWNFRYWNRGRKYKFGHHAQMGQIADAIYKYGKYNYDYMIFNDMDEYFHIENYTIREYITNHSDVSVFGFCNIWSNLLPSDYENNIVPNEIPCEFLIGLKKRYKHQSKNIYNLHDIQIAGIHEPYSFFQKKKSILNLNMYHFYKWNKNRTINENWIKIKIKM